MCKHTPPVVLAILLLSCAAVQPAPQPQGTCPQVILPIPSEPVSLVRTPANDCQCMCANLQKLGCCEGDNQAECVDVCDRALQSGKFDLKLTCVSEATSKTQVRKCGTVQCKDRS